MISFIKKSINKLSRHNLSEQFSTLRDWFFAESDRENALTADTHRSRIALRITLLALSIFLLWSTLAELDQITRATGSVIASSRSQVIQTVDGGVLKELLVKEIGRAHV